jgi:hypothetical protein
MAMKKEYYEFDPASKEIQPVDMKAVIKEKAGKIDKWKLFKQVAGAVASGCASIVVSRYLKASMPPAQNVAETAIMGVGTYLITGVVGQQVAKYAEQELDDWRDSIMMVKETVDEAKGE